MFRVPRCCPVAPVLLAGLLGVAGCQRETGDEHAAPSSSASDSNRVLLTGTFERVAKKVTGRVELVQAGGRYQLRLLNVSVDNLGEVHVYFVGLPEAKSTLVLATTQTQYDFGPLEQGSPEQLIDLPSKPASELRTVVLYEPRYRVNLAAASLK